MSRWNFDGDVCYHFDISWHLPLCCAEKLDCDVECTVLQVPRYQNFRMYRLKCRGAAYGVIWL